MLPARSTEESRKTIAEEENFCKMDKCAKWKSLKRIQNEGYYTGLVLRTQAKNFPLDLGMNSCNASGMAKVKKVTSISSNTVISRIFWKGSYNSDIKMGKDIAYKTLRKKKNNHTNYAV